MINTFRTPRRIASMQQLTLGIIPPLMTPSRMSLGASLTGISLISVESSSLFLRIPAISVMEIKLSAFSSPAILAAAVSALML